MKYLKTYDLWIRSWIPSEIPIDKFDEYCENWTMKRNMKNIIYEIFKNI